MSFVDFITLGIFWRGLRIYMWILVLVALALASPRIIEAWRLQHSEEYRAKKSYIQHLVDQHNHISGHHTYQDALCKGWEIKARAKLKHGNIKSWKLQVVNGVGGSVDKDFREILGVCIKENGMPDSPAERVQYQGEEVSIITRTWKTWYVYINTENGRVLYFQDKYMNKYYLPDE